jgi:hypothetical protein
MMDMHARRIHAPDSGRNEVDLWHSASLDKITGDRDMTISERGDGAAGSPSDVIGRFTGPWHGLSNFASAWVYLDGKAYPTVEHAFQAAKTLDPVERENIRLAPTPAEAKALGRAVELRPDWEDVKFSIMYELLLWKFMFEPYRSLLLSTGTAELVETNFWRDMTWGVYGGKGENHLGRLLMKIREGLVLCNSSSHKRQSRT